MDSSVNPQPTDAHIRISHAIHRELIRRKFTQRQRDILDFILTLSWGCGKPSAIIPQLKDFELCGVRKNHIRNELQQLVTANVIFWEERANVFQFNKHYDQWEIDPIAGFDTQKMKNLISLNLDTQSPNLAKKVPEKGTEFPKKEPGSVTESGTEFLKRELPGSQKGNFPVTESGTGRRVYPLRVKGFSASKASIKAILKKRTTTTTTEQAKKKLPDDYSFATVFRAYEESFIAGGKVTGFDVEEFSTLFDDFGGEWVLKGMREAYRHGSDKRTLAYLHGVLKGYKNRGGPDASTPPKVEPSTGSGRKSTRVQENMNELDKLIAEEERIHEHC